MNLFEILAGAFWLARDFAIIGTVVLSIMGILDSRIRARAATAWIVGLLGVLAGLATEDYTSGLLNLTDGTAITGLAVAAVFILFTPRIRAAVRG